MNKFTLQDEEFMALLDAYIDGHIQDTQMNELQSILLASAPARSLFVRYCRLETDLHLAVRSQQVSEKSLRFLEAREWANESADRLPATPRPAPRNSSVFQRLADWKIYAAIAACLFLAVALRGRPVPSSPELPSTALRPIVASLVNAQDCKWKDQTGISGPMRAGQILNLHAGLVEIHFARGAEAVMEGPALMELLTDNSVRLVRGKLSTRVSESSHGFEVQLPLGKVVDLGTEFGVVVGEDDAADVYVFTGRVEAYASHAQTPKVAVDQNQAARLDTSGLVVDTNAQSDMHHFIRSIPIADVGLQMLALDFGKAIDSAIGDGNGRGIGLSDRLPGTGGRLPTDDHAFNLNLSATHLEFIPPVDGLLGQSKLEFAEFLGTQLSTYHFTGQQDFEVSSRLVSVPHLGEAGEIGLYVGTDAKHLMRGGIVMDRYNSYHGFMANHLDSQDSDAQYAGSFSEKSNIKLTLQRLTGRYLLRVQNQSMGNGQTLSIRTPQFLMDQKNLHVGFYAFNSRPDPNAKITFRDFKTSVWTNH